MNEPGRRVLFRIRGVSKKFNSKTKAGCVAADKIDLDIYEGECLLIAGSNGSGKSVMMRMLAGLMTPDEGEIIYRGTPISQLGNSIRPAIGLIFQDPDAQIIGQTVEEDIRFGPENQKLKKDEVTARAYNVMEKLDLLKKKDYSPRTLSGGEKRRLAAAGVLAMGCDAIIMDEPFANLDWPGVVQVLKIIKELKSQNKTVIILTHELEKVLALSDRLVILDQGKIRDSGIPDEVLDRLEDIWGVRDPRHRYEKASDCTWL